jgi:hypothetical protein
MNPPLPGLQLTGSAMVPEFPEFQCHIFRNLQQKTEAVGKVILKSSIFLHLKCRYQSVKHFLNTSTGELVQPLGDDLASTCNSIEEKSGRRWFPYDLDNQLC